MDIIEAEQVIYDAVFHGDGTFMLLRLGVDPGIERIHSLRLALRVVWRDRKSAESLPYRITQLAAIILKFESEAQQNLLRNESIPRSNLTLEVSDLAQGAFDILMGSRAETVRRRDLGE